jgi:hypothetical protein
MFVGQSRRKILLQAGDNKRVNCTSERYSERQPKGSDKAVAKLGNSRLDYIYLRPNKVVH